MDGPVVWSIIAAIGIAAVWGRNGKEILYLDEHARMVSVEASAQGDSIELGKPQTLFSTQPVGPGLFEATRRQPLRDDTGSGAEFVESDAGGELAAGN